MSTADTKALIEEGIANFQKEVPALQQLRLVMELELRGRGDIQLFRVEVPGPRSRGTSRPTRRSACRCRARTSTGSPARARSGTGARPSSPAPSGPPARRDPQADPERRGEAGGAAAEPQAPRPLSPTASARDRRRRRRSPDHPTAVNWNAAVRSPGSSGSKVVRSASATWASTGRCPGPLRPAPGPRGPVTS